MAFVRTISVGLPRARAWAGIGRTSIDKRPVPGPVAVHPLGIEGDQVSDTRHHGGPDQAVYAYAREDLDFWERELGLPIRDGHFGENLTTEGIDVNALEIGTRLQIGEPGVGILVEAVYVRIPCNDFKGWMGESGYDARAWVRRFAAVARPGPYLRVLETGVIAPGDPVGVAHRPGHGRTIRDMFVALTTDRSRLPDLLEVDGLLPKVRAKAEEFVQRTAGSLPPAEPVA
ncbi:MOSC domain-containing protein [Nocardioides sp. L-11A]|uniref:MOSC domain-containing protein n=1 Tax=Nocardioides sp. L-11A TaxID=3043848 RepID=UPI00249CB79F|nr:MOSC domain-containing protein [Nocardioides sp. L-11A]